MFKLLAITTAMVVLALPAQAGGSMSSGVKIIHVNPSSSVRVYDELRRQKEARSDDAKAAHKEEVRQSREAEKFEQKRALQADKAYQKRLAADRKRRNK